MAIRVFLSSQMGVHLHSGKSWAWHFFPLPQSSPFAPSASPLHQSSCSTSCFYSQLLLCRRVDIGNTVSALHGNKNGGKKWHKLFANCLTHAGHCPCYDHQHSVTWRRERCHCCFVSLCRAPRSVQASCSSLWKYLYMTHVYSKQQPGCDGATDHVIILVNVWCVDHQARKSEKHIHNRDSLADTQMDRASL